MIDEPTAIREGEELNTETVKAFLKDTIPGLKGDLVIKQFPSGFSNLTYSISMGDRVMVLRRPPFGKKAKGAHDMSREYKILSALKPLFPYCPEPLVYSEDPQVMGCPFYVMERIPGIILRKNLPKGLSFKPADASKLCENFIDILHSLHTINYKEIGLGEFGKPKGYVRRQIEGWTQRYRDAKTDDAPDYEKVIAWLHEKMPEDCPSPGIIHNDYKFDNVVLNSRNPLEIIGILDWEMATIGDPLMELGSSLAYWVNHDDPDDVKLTRTMPTDIHGMLTRDELVKLYLEKSGHQIDTFDYYYCYGLFRLAGISQQIYYRFYHGQTKDERFGLLIVGVQIFEQMALRVIERSDL